MKLFTFKKGIHPPYGKYLTENKSIEVYLPKRDLVFPMSQHIGAPCNPIVKVGDRVLVGQKIGEGEGFVSSPIFSSVSGTVKEIAPKMVASGQKILSVVIENDKTYETVTGFGTKRDLSKLTNEEIVTIVKDNGIVGLGGACFPTHVKLAPPKDKVIDAIVINAAECEPYLTCDHRLMLEKADEILEGVKVLQKLFANAKVYIGIEDNKKDAISLLTEKSSKLNNVAVVALKTKYPQGSEKHLIYATTKREVPSGKLPSDVGCVVQNIATVQQLYKTVICGQPLLERVVTITGEAIKTPKNLLVKLGTSFSELIEACDGFNVPPVKVIAGGPMMGMAISSFEIPVVKGTSGILCLDANQAKLEEETLCIRCGKCIDSCPMNLLPENLHKAAKKNKLDEFEKLYGMDCIECGCCSFSCPAKNSLVEEIRKAKRQVIENRKKQK